MNRITIDENGVCQSDCKRTKTDECLYSKQHAAGRFCNGEVDCKSYLAPPPRALDVLIRLVDYHERKSHTSFETEYEPIYEDAKAVIEAADAE